MLLSGCIDAVTLGTDCVQRFDRCFGSEGPPGKGQGNLGDASFIDASRPMLDASVDADVADAMLDESDVDVIGPPALPFPGIENGSFELTRGQAGALAIEAFDPIPLGSNVAEPWSACRGGFNALEKANSVYNSGAGDVTPREGRFLIEADTGFASLSGLRQPLITPLLKGQTYTFRIDVRAAVGSGVTLELWGSTFSCAKTIKLADVGVISDQGWSTPCVTFTPTMDFPQIMLVPANAGLSTASPTRVFFDALRRDDSCR